MWFRLAIYPGRADLVAAVNIHGDVYFRADDVGRFLGYGNPYQFAHHYATLDLMNGIPASIAANQPGKRRKILCFTFHQMIQVMKLTKSRHDMGNTDDLVRLWENGVVKKDPCFCVEIDPRRASKLVVLDPSVGDEKTCRLQDWIQCYAQAFHRSYYLTQLKTELSKVRFEGKPLDEGNDQSMDGDLIIDEGKPVGNDQSMDGYDDLIMDEPMNLCNKQSGIDEPVNPFNKQSDIVEPMNPCNKKSGIDEPTNLKLPLCIQHCLDIEYVCENNVIPDKIRLKVGDEYHLFEMKK